MPRHYSTLCIQIVFKMDTLDDSENTAKISDSAYSNSCSNSQSRRSHSTKSTKSGSNSSGSSGYSGKPSTSSSSNNLGKEKEAKKKKQPQVETVVLDVTVETEMRPTELASDFDASKEEISGNIVDPASSPAHPQSDKRVESMDICMSERSSIKDEVVAVFNLSQFNLTVNTTANHVVDRSTPAFCSDGFSCVISMHDGVVMYTTSSLTATLGFPKDMWIGRSFIDFIHPRDRSTFASQITSGLAVPKIVNGTQIEAQSPANSISSMVCRIRRYRGLTSGFSVKDRSVSYMPFLLKLSFKDINDEERKVIYLVIQATPFFSAFKTPHEVVTNAVPFVMRHAANGNIEYMDPESVPYLGFLPQDLAETDALRLYHPEDLSYMRQVYEIIVKEGGLPRSKVYRMMTQNGDYIKLETEWSSFINPWSKKLEFVIGKHHLIEGPASPDVFQVSDPDKAPKLSDEDKNKAIMFRETIIRIMNQVPTKPAEAAKQQMSKRCQDLASFMESLMEDQPKTDEELRLDIQDPDHSYYERDSVMLGGISPHHDYNDSKSSTETPLSYNQLNYNETLQRYFASHQPHSYEDYNTVAAENILGLKDSKPVLNHCLSPMASSSSDSNLMAIGSPTARSGDLLAIRLTETLLTKHNTEMEKKLLKIHRETRTSNKDEREKATNETRQKKKEHLARCNASYQPTTAGGASTTENQPHGVKRSSKFLNTETSNAHKHHCTSPRQSRRMRERSLSTSVAVAQPSSAISTTVAASHWPVTSVSNMNTFILGVGIPQQMSFMSPVPAVSGVFPMYYAPAATAANIPATPESNATSSNTATMCQPPTMQCMMYGQPMYGPQFVYSPMTPQMSYPFQQTMMGQTMLCTNSINSLGLTNRNYEEACKPSIMLRAGRLGGWRDKKRPESKATSSKIDLGCEDISSSTKALNRSTEAVPETPRDGHIHQNKMNRFGNSEETVDRTDGESSYSSFYSSFFKTESGSAEESGDAKKNEAKDSRMRSPIHCIPTYYEPKQVKKVTRRKMEPPWMEQVCLTSELIYKYQILTKNVEEVLTADKQKLSSFEQPSLVNDQLGQLYLDMQLEGVAARLTLEEGITSSSSSGEETSIKPSKVTRRKREYSKLVMIYEEDAPMPPGEGELEPEPSASTSTPF
ncbi:unnamed protein product [Arctia plantaginis]|uniref:Period circadian protein n=1 Tax=Arctia plantaginis TaxID=874455 RepID=A0A8S0Z495_ARCPL|nr:unnamed protein product [Arctia plantaginis]